MFSTPQWMRASSASRGRSMIEKQPQILLGHDPRVLQLDQPDDHAVRRLVETAKSAHATLLNGCYSVALSPPTRNLRTGAAVRPHSGSQNSEDSVEDAGA